MLRRQLLILMLGACGRVAFDARGDAGADGSAACSAWGPFSTPTELTGSVHSPADEWFPTPSADGLELYFHSFRIVGNTGGIYRATRATVDEPFGAAAVLATVDTVDFEAAPTLTDDGLVMMFSRNGDLFEARRAQTTDAFDPGTFVSAVNTANPDEAPFLDGAGLRLVMSHDETFGALYETTRPSRDEPFATPRLIAELDAPEVDGSPTLSTDGLELFFASARTGGMGGKDVWTARRPTVDEPFGPAQHVPELSSTRDEWGLRLSRDGRTMYLNYDAVTAGGMNSQMFTATRACL